MNPLIKIFREKQPDNESFRDKCLGNLFEFMYNGVTRMISRHGDGLFLKTHTITAEELREDHNLKFPFDDERRFDKVMPHWLWRIRHEFFSVINPIKNIRNFVFFLRHGFPKKDLWSLTHTFVKYVHETMIHTEYLHRIWYDSPKRDELYKRMLHALYYFENDLDQYYFLDFVNGDDGMKYMFDIFLENPNFGRKPISFLLKRLKVFKNVTVSVPPLGRHSDGNSFDYNKWILIIEKIILGLELYLDGTINRDTIKGFSYLKKYFFHLWD